ncbi:MAG: cardiolipin synthase [Clostridiales Family XIII bacterium]|nr:cardiolipin synthase [Clostridiales Family XIII bacterium]
MIAFFAEHIDVSFVVFLLYIADFAVAGTIIFLERKDASATIAWVMLVFVVPVAGIVLYFLLSQNIARMKLFRLTGAEKESVETPLREQIESMEHGRFVWANEEERRWGSLIQLNQSYAKAYLTQNNEVEIFTEGVKMFDALLESIAAAEERIHAEYYIIKNDGTGQALLRALTEAAGRGVSVRLLADALGTRSLDKGLLRKFEAAGGKIAFFFPPKFVKLNLRFNYRNHRKLVLVDGKTGYLGGFNIGDEYLGKKKKFGLWRDTHLRVRGACAGDLDARFLLDWRLASREDVNIARAYYDFGAAAGDTSMQIVSSGPDSSRQEVKHAYLKMISGAKRSIYIQTPYFVPDESIFDSLLTAAFAGVDVRIMIPSIRDHIFVYWATLYYCGLLLRAGVKVYLYQNGFLHAKTICADGEVCSVGSANFDIRSFRLNFETNAFIFDKGQAGRMDAIYARDMAHCTELTREMYDRRPALVKIREALAKLVSDLL